MIFILYVFHFQKKLKSGLLVTTASITVFSVASIYYEKQKFYEKYLVPLTHKLDPESAHKLTIFWFKTGFVPRSEYVDTPLLVSYNVHDEHFIFDLSKNIDNNIYRLNKSSICHSEIPSE